MTCINCGHDPCLQTEDCPGGRHYERQMARLGDTIPSQAERAQTAPLVDPDDPYDEYDSDDEGLDTPTEPCDTAPGPRGRAPSQDDSESAASPTNSTTSGRVVGQ